MVSNINIGYDIPNIRKIINTVAEVFGIDKMIHVSIMKMKLDNYAYAVSQNGQNVIYISDKILKKDEINAFNIRLIIHEMWHLNQIIKGELIVGNSIFTWKGREYSVKDKDNRPWEVEAIKAELIYYKTIKNKLS